MARGGSRDRPFPPLAHFGGPDRPPRHLRNLLEAQIAAVGKGGSIYWMTYYFRDEALAEALVDARRRGVEVRVCVEGWPRRAHANDAVIARLRAGLGPGLRVVHGLPSHLHAKIYCFEGDRPTALIGSFNPSGNDPEDPAVVAAIGDQDRGHNLLVETADPVLFRALRDRVAAVHAGAGAIGLALQGHGRAIAAPGTEAIFFPCLPPNRLEQRLLALEPGAALRIAASHVRDGHVARCLAGLVQRGVSVSLLTGHTRRRTPPRMERFLADHGVEVRRFVHPDGLPMHCKFILADSAAGRWAAFGSYNLTRTSRWLNQELLVFSDDPGLWSSLDGRWRDIVAAPPPGAGAGAVDAPRTLPAGSRALSIVMVDSHRRIERGGAVQCARLAEALAARGHSVTCVFDGPSSETAEGGEWQRLEQAGVRIERFRLLDPADMIRFRRMIAAQQPDIVHSHKNRALRFVAAATAGRRGFGWVANRGTVYSLLPGTPAWALHRFRVDRIVAVAEAVRERLIRDFIPKERVSLIYGSFDAARFRPETSGAAMRARWGVPPDVPLIGMAASFKSLKKGHGDFLRAARHIVAERPDTHFVIAGDGSAARAARLARRLGIADRLRLPGFVEDMPAALAAIDVLVCASVRGEGLSGSVREALAMARPVVSTDVAGNRELVRDGVTGLLVPVRDPPAIAGAVLALLDRPAWAAGLAAAGRALVLDLCTNERRAERVERLYRDLLAERAARGEGQAAKASSVTA